MDSDTDTDFEETATRCASCIFNNDQLRLPMSKIKEIEVKLSDELKEGSDFPEELIAVLNFYTWIQFKLENDKKAKETNAEALTRTDWENITSVVSRVYILWRDGDELEAKDCLAKVEVLKKSSEGEKLMTEAEAEMAYAYSRLGGPENLTNAIELYAKVVLKQPDKYVWKYRLGLAYRRATHGNISLVMKSNGPVLDHVKKATELLFDVAQHSPHTLVRARALSQLAVMRSHTDRFLKDTNCDDIFRDKDVMSLIEEARSYGSEDAKTLSECGRTLRYTNLEEATRLLEKSRELKKTSTTLHHLGLCYESLAKKADKSGQLPTNVIIKCPPKVTYMNKEDTLVGKAIECFRQAIEISCGNNNPARYSLGLTLRACGELDDANIQFNKIIHLTSKKRVPGHKIVKGKNKQNDYLITVNCAYEQAGLCLLELAKETGKTKEEIQNLNEEGEKKLLKAVSLAAMLSNLESEMERYKNQIWNVFKTLETQYEELQDSPQAVKKYLNLLTRVSKPEKILAVIEKFRGMSKEELTDPVVIKSGLESYLALRKYESAFAFLNLVMTTQPFNDGLQRLESVLLKVRLSAAASRLQTSDGDARIILKPLFGSCIEKGDVRSTDDHQEEQVGEDVGVSEEVQEQDIKDVLILYDRGDTETSDALTMKVKKLQRIMSDDFGMDVSLIDDRLSPGKIQLIEQVHEISRARVVLVLLSREPKSSLYESVLKYIPSIIKDCKEESRPEPNILLGLLDEGIRVEQMLKVHGRITLWELLDRVNVVLEGDDGEDSAEPIGAQAEISMLGPSVPADYQAGSLTPSRTDLGRGPDHGGHEGSSGEFNDGVTAKMSFFCALINKEWPIV